MKIISEINDDREFVNEMERIITSVTFSHNLSPIGIVKIDNWFDHKWLGHSNSKIPRSWKASNGFIADRGLPGFPSSRILNTNFYELKVKQIKRIENQEPYLTECKGCFFYSGNTLLNKRGSLMVYISVENNQYWFWYSSFIFNNTWKIDTPKGISIGEITQYRKGKS